MRRVSLSLALACAFAVTACSQGAKAPGNTGSAKGVLGQYFYLAVPSPAGGTIVSTDGRINCQPDGTGCGDAVYHQTQYAWNTSVTLTANAMTGYTFKGWAGDCFGSRVAANVCTFTGSDAATDYLAVAVFQNNNQPKPPADTTAGRIYGYVFDSAGTPKAAGGVVVALRDANPANVVTFSAGAGSLSKQPGSTIVTVNLGAPSSVAAGNYFTVVPNELAGNSDVAFKAGGYAILSASANGQTFTYDDATRNLSAAAYVSSAAKTFSSAISLQAAASGANGSYVFELAPGTYSLTADDGNMPAKYTSAAAQLVTLPTIKDAGCVLGNYVPTAGVATAPGCLLKLANVTVGNVGGYVAPGAVTARSGGAATKYLAGFSTLSSPTTVAMTCTPPAGGAFVKWEQTAGPTAIDTSAWAASATLTLPKVADLLNQVIDPVKCPLGRGSLTLTSDTGVTLRNAAFGCGVRNFVAQGRGTFLSVNKQAAGEMQYSFRCDCTDANGIPVGGTTNVQLMSFVNSNPGNINAQSVAASGGQPAVVGPASKGASGTRAQMAAGTIAIADQAAGTYNWQLCTNSNVATTWSCTAASVTVNDATTRNPWFVVPNTATWKTAGSSYYLWDGNVGGAVLVVRGNPWGGALNTCGNCHQPNTPGGTDAKFSGAPTTQWNDWVGSKHNQIMIDGGSGTHYTSSCFPCHTLGYDAAVSNGGWDDVAASQGMTGLSATYALPDFTFEGPTTQIFFGSMPAALQKVSMIQCENCHGPAPAQTTQSFSGASHTGSLSSKVCAFCHDGGHHGLYSQWVNTGHGNLAGAQGEGPNHGRDQNHCARCHFAQGFIEYVDAIKSGNPDRMGDVPPAGAPVGALTAPILCASYATAVTDTCPNGLTTNLLTVNNVEPVSCQTCHDPHSLELRITGADSDTSTGGAGLLVAGGFKITNGGSGSICAVCHNSRNGVLGALAPNPNPGNASGAAYVGIAGVMAQHNDATPLTSDSRTIPAGTAPAQAFGMTGPHTPSQADVYYAGNGYLLGQSMPKQPNYHQDPNWFADTCVECHVRRFTAETAEWGTVVNHSFEVDANTCISCHGVDKLTPRQTLVAGKMTAYLSSLTTVLKSAGIVIVNGSKNGGAAADYNLTTNAVTITAVAVSGDRPLTLDFTMSNGDKVTGCNIDKIFNDAPKTIPTLYTVSGTVKTYANVAKSMYNYALIKNDNSSGVHNLPFVDAMFDAMINHLDTGTIPK